VTTWKTFFASTPQRDMLDGLRAFIHHEKASGKVICPPKDDILQAFRLTEFDTVKIVILGQDPYHGIGQAHGLAFSVNERVAIPPSLMNIYREISSDLGIDIPKSGNLNSWAEQGVLLLNTVLTVELNRANSHRGVGWEAFTDAIIKCLSEEKAHLVFLLWGKSAQHKQVLVDKRHTVLIAPHPSPLSACRGFFGCRHFSRANKALMAHQQRPIDWSVKSG